jgi:hypothetical protein
MSVIFFSSRYEKSLKETKKLGIKKAVMNGLLMDRDKMCTLYGGPSIDASYQVSVYLAQGFQRKRILYGTLNIYLT